MFKHIILMQFPEAADRQEAERRLRELKDKIDVIQDLEVGSNVVPSDRAFDLGLVVTLPSADDLKEYVTHPAHEEVAGFIRERRSASASCDFVVE